MINEAIVLAGGKGTRLQGMVNDRPKPMALINGKPFLEYLLKKLEASGIRKVILCVGYKYESIIDYFGYRFGKLQLVYTLEETPLGTGGAIVLGLNEVKKPNVLVLNGDTFFDIDIQAMINYHLDLNCDITMALKDMPKPDRYGTVTIDNIKKREAREKYEAMEDAKEAYERAEERLARGEEINLDDYKIKEKSEGEKKLEHLRKLKLQATDPYRIVRFKEKRAGMDRGFINAGIYIIKKKLLADKNMGDRFSFEQAFLEKEVNKLFISGFTSKEYFIDIGIPSDYMKANEDFKNR